ncbi:CBS domain-containing protein [Amycolatopsis sp. NPDC059027]|uniref:CBS domain-containing protein n=1 Tax=unclassified Amycolatopsis TaxID=2618356 RepID=UPI00366DC7FB
MTTKVYAVDEDTPVKEIARILVDHKVSALPVLGEQRQVAGVVSEADLVLKQAGAASPAGLAPLFGRTRTTGRVASEVMSAPAVTVSQDAQVIHAARLMVGHRMKRLPVVDGRGRLVGIVSRSDLVPAFVRTDEELHEEIVHGVLAEALSVAGPPDGVAVRVIDGVAELRGVVRRRSLVPLVVALVRRVPGVVDVTEELSYTWDDTVGAERDR